MSVSSPASSTDVRLYSPGELNHHRRSARRRAEPSCGCARWRVRPSRDDLNRRVVVLAGEFGRHACRLALRARPDPGLSDLLRLPYHPYSCDIRPSGPYTSRFVLIKVILEDL
ncbi:hypothetical protein DY000_02041211 [Brassica cretica]|uniref:Uncharacterized protein n=1 Tax=Brassica cretica TaxID=69181 RepID=A0ABQ7BDQ0_BRACR|nr:hypothetical protein DY000_02041211 [Brassica cretica]